MAEGRSERVLFGDDFLRKLEVLSLALRRPAHGQLKGMHRSRRTGAGMVFSDYRAYAPGDDIRHIDWGVYLRMDRLVLRLFEEEADLPVYLFVDASRSMDFGASAATGGQSKFDYARRLAAVLAYVALLGHDRVSLIACSEASVETLPTRRSRNQAPQVFRFLEQLSARGGTNLFAAMRNAFGTRRTRGLAIVVSDFLDRNGPEEAFSLLRRLGHEVILLHVVSPEERHPQLPEEVVLVDSEEGTATELEVTPALLAAYEQTFVQFAGELEAYARKYGWGYLQAPTDFPFEDLALKVLRRQGLLR